MEKHLRILSVTFTPGRPYVGIQVQPMLVDDDGTETPLGGPQVVDTDQDTLQRKKGEWGDADVERVVRTAEIELEPEVPAVLEEQVDGEVTREAAEFVPAKRGLRFPDLEIVY